MNIDEMRKRFKKLEAAGHWSEADDLLDQITTIESRGKWNKHARSKHDDIEENYQTIPAS